MSLLDKATIITTPTAHSNGKLHSIKGGSVADFDVVRGSAATRVNAEGLIEDISTLSGELVTNGDFSNGSTGWTEGTGWSVSDGTANCDGTNLAYLTQASIIFTGVSYKVQFDIVDYTSGSIKYRDNGLVGGQSFSGVGSYTDYVVAGGGQFRLMSENFIGSIDNVSVVEVIDATNIPRIDYTDGTASILLEPQSTNLLTYSEDFSQWATSGNAVVSDDFAISPNGNINASKFTFDGTTNSTVNNTIPVTDGIPYTFSVWLKNNDLSDATKVWIGLSTATQGEYVTVTNVWKRFVITSTSNGTVEYPRVQTSEVGSIFAWGAQLEALPYATSYIPTSGAIATRLADAVTGAGDATTFNSTEGVLYVEASLLSDSINDSRISISDGTSVENRITFRYLDNNEFNAQIGFTNGFSETVTLNSIVDYNKIALVYNSTNASLFVNGFKVATDTMSALSGLSQLQFNRFGGTANDFYGKVKSVITFDTALTDAELECLTTI